VSGEVIILGAAAIAVIFGIYKYSTAESNDYNAVLQQVSSLKGDIKTLNTKLDDHAKWNEDQGKEIEALRLTVIDYGKRSDEVGKDLGEAQDHLARMRDSQMDLKDRSYPRQVEIQLRAPSGPIPIQILQPSKPKRVVTRKKVIKTKTGYQSRSETRESELKGDPTAPPLKKKKKVLKKKSLAKSKTK